MKFGIALEHLRAGKPIRRDGWPVTDHLLLVTHAEVRCQDHKGYETSAASPAGVDLWIVKRAYTTLQPWSPTQTDVLAEDWRLMGGNPFRFSEGTSVKLKDTGGTWNGIVIIPKMPVPEGSVMVEFHNAPTHEGYASGQQFVIPIDWLTEA